MGFIDSHLDLELIGKKIKSVTAVRRRMIRSCRWNSRRPGGAFKLWHHGRERCLHDPASYSSARDSRCYKPIKTAFFRQSRGDRRARQRCRGVGKALQRRKARELEGRIRLPGVKLSLDGTVVNTRPRSKNRTRIGRIRQASCYTMPEELVEHFPAGRKRKTYKS